MAVEVELRVHGIGDHKSLSAQGSGDRIRETNQGLSIFKAPEPPGHTVHFLNWSRTSRSGIGLLWYLAFPYTLLSMAAAMRPPQGRIARTVHALVVFVSGLALTVGAAIWVLVTVETVFYFVAGTREVEWLPSVLTIGVALMFAALVLHGSLREARGPIPWIRGLINAVAVGCIFFWLYQQRPAAQTIDPRDPRFGSFNLSEILALNDCWHGEDLILPKSGYPLEILKQKVSSHSCVVFESDFVTRFAIYSIVGALVVFVTFSLWSLLLKGRTWSGLASAPLLGAGTAILAATVLLHTGWSAVRLAVAWILTYFDRNFSSLGFLDLKSGTKSLDSVVNVWAENEGTRMHGTNVVAGLLLPAVVVVFLFLFIRAIKSKALRTKATSTVDSPPRLKLWTARLKHRLIVDSSRYQLALLVGVPVLALAWLSARWWRWLGGPVDEVRGDWLTDLSVFSVHLLYVGVVLFLMIRSLREPLSVLGDVAGYWDSTHPLAGRSYRSHVVKEIRKQLTETTSVALVGHSQGSVLAFEAVSQKLPPDAGSVHLVTCGSPLASLYERFFPDYFRPKHYEPVAEKTSGCTAGTSPRTVKSWKNFWRNTDPIASSLGPEGSALNRELPDPPPGSATLRGHGDYWLEQDQRAYISELASESSAPKAATPRSP